MPICAEDGCPEQVPRGYCATHAPRRAPSRRSPSSRVTGTARWRRVKARVLRRDAYVCHYCGGLADTVDHRVPVVGAPELAYAESNLVAACTACNLQKGDR